MSNRNPRAPRIEPANLGGEDNPDPTERPPRILGTVAKHPHLLKPMLGFSSALASGALPRRESEILALRAAWNCRSDFEWGHHSRYGLAAGLTQEEIDRLAGGDATVGWNEADAALVRAADELHASQDIDDATWAILAKSWDEGQLVEIPFVVGQYTMLSMVAKSLGVPIDESLPEIP